MPRRVFLLHKAQRPASNQIQLQRKHYPKGTGFAGRHVKLHANMLRTDTYRLSVMHTDLTAAITCPRL